jgi:hypothetical protein
MVLEILLCDLMLVLFAAAIDDGNLLGFGPSAHATTKVPRHPHQVSIVQFLIATVVQLSPPPTEATC